jgi:5-methylcytosine-specific restriction endonuclease McrA
MSTALNTYNPDEAIWIEPNPVRAGTRRMRRWRQRNPDKARVQSQVASHRTKSRRRGLLTTLTVAEWVSLLERIDYRCVACLDLPDTLTIDCIKPQSRGGPLSLDNVQPLCIKCNKSKGQKEIDYRSNYYERSNNV